VGAIALVLLTTKYLLGAGEAAVNEPFREVAPTVLNNNPVGNALGVTHGLKTKGVQVNVRPADGNAAIDVEVNLTL